MARLTAGVLVSHPATGEPTFLPEGSDAPEWADGLLGDHVLAAGEPAEANDGEEPVKPSGNATLEEWQAYARAQGATDADLDGKKRDELRDQYGA